MTVQIQGLSKRQRAIADVLWMMQTREDAERFIASLALDTQRDAHTVVEMMQLAIIDEIDSVEESTRLIIDNCRY
jgi:hypothetical protein